MATYTQYFGGLVTQTLGYPTSGGNSLPTFSGIGSAVASDDGCFVISWPATGSTVKPPLRYEVYGVKVPDGELSVPASGLFLSTNIISISQYSSSSVRVMTLPDQLTYFVKDKSYTFGVRAMDSQSYRETNVATITVVSVASGNMPLVLQDIAKSLKNTSVILTSSL